MIKGIIILLLSLGLDSSFVSNKYGSCDFFQQLQPNQNYYIYSPGYPSSYPPGSSCRWFAEAPEGYQVVTVCESFSIPQSQGCWMDSLSISLTGDLDLNDAMAYCGSQPINEVSIGRRMNIVLSSSVFSRGGNFLCSIGVQEVPERPPDCHCGWKNPLRIVGGRETGVNEYPMMAALVDKDERNLFCGAIIISTSFALTAAHCLIDKETTAVGLLVGDHDISRGNDTDSAKLFKIINFIRHPEYDSETQENDIALVQADRPMQFNLKVGPVCLPFNHARKSFTGETVTALGWGSLQFGGQSSNSLQKVDLNVVSNAQCQQSYENPVFNTEICTFTPKKDACQSDSGGPLLWTDPKTKAINLVGIISYGRQCANKHPSVNTRVSMYLSWIVDNADDEFCVK